MMKKINAAKAHYRLWMWLSENPGQEKDDWPEWKRLGGKIPRVDLDCFACEVAAIIDIEKEEQDIFVDKDCVYCPIGNKGRLCSHHTHRDGSFNERASGKFSRWAEYNNTDNFRYNSKKASKLAKEIANLPWNGRKMIEIYENISRYTQRN